MLQSLQREYTHRNRKSTLYKIVRTYGTNTRLKVTVSWNASLPVTRCGVTTMTWSQNDSPWSGDMNSPMNKKFKMRVKWCALHFGSGIGWYCWISRNLGKPSTLTSTLRLWLRWGLKLPKSGQRRQLFSYNTITSVPIPVWWPWSTLQVLSGLPYHTHHMVWNWHLLISMFLGRLKMDFMGNIFLATTPL